MATDADAVDHTVEQACKLGNNTPCVRLQLRAAKLEHRPPFEIDDLNAQAFIGQVNQQLIAVLPERWNFLDRGLDLQLEGFQLFTLALPQQSFQVVFQRDARIGAWHFALSKSEILAAALNRPRLVTNPLTTENRKTGRVLEIG